MKKIQYRVSILLIIIICIATLSACKRIDHIPSEGIWYCDELQMQLSDKYDESFMMVEGTKVTLGWGASDPGTNILMVCSLHYPETYYDYGEYILTATKVALTESQFLVKTSDNVYYIFERID